MLITGFVRPVWPIMKGRFKDEESSRFKYKPVIFLPVTLLLMFLLICSSICPFFHYPHL